MRYLLICFVFLFTAMVLPAVAAENNLAVKVKENCAAKWSGNYAMQKFCIDRQKKAWGEVNKLIATFKKGSEELKIINRCAVKWPGKTGGLNFAMVKFCADRQIKAYRSLQ